MTDLFSFGLLSFTSLFTIIDPIAAAPVFVTMTEKFDHAARRRMAYRACIVALTILVTFAIGGGVIFKTFGITIDALRIAGGILFFVMSMQMLIGGHKNEKVDNVDHDPSVVPLGIPLICGPGAISTIMVLMGQQSSIWHMATLLIALLLVISLTALILLISPQIMRRLGRTGVAVITRIIAMIVCAIGIQFIIDGLKPVVIGILHNAR